MDPVLELFKKQNINYTSSGRDYLIKCLNPEHEDNNPSLRVDKLTGIAHCFACGWKKNLFKYYGIIGSSLTPIRINKLREKLLNLAAVDTLPLINGYTPWNTSYRNISLKTLKQFEAFYTLDSNSNMTDRIIFPVKNYSNDIVAYIGRHVGNEKPKYKFYPKHVNIPLYPIRHNTNSVVFVEGIFDLLNLYDNGLTNVVCCFGTDTLKSDAKDKTLALKAQGVTKIYIMFDGDKPGITAANSIKPILEELDFMVETITLPEGLDPGELSLEQIDMLKGYINNAN